MTIKFNPSSAERWTKCLASLKLVEQLPPEKLFRDTDASREGTIAHRVAEQLLKNQPAGVDSAVTQEMIDYGTAYRDWIYEQTAGDHVFVEEKFFRDFGHGEMTGKVDAWWFDSETATLHVVDYKYGRQPVEAARNLQLMLYAWLMEAEAAECIKLYIYQPRRFDGRGPVSEWTVRPADMEAFLAEAIEAINTAGQGVYPYKPGPQCRYCPARLNCWALRVAADDLPLVDKMIATRPRDLTPEQIGTELAALEPLYQVLGQYLDAMREELTDAIKSGQHVPGWDLRPGRTVKCWVEGFDKVLPTIEAITGLDLHEHKPLSPAKIQATGVDKRLVMPYIISQPSGYKLKRVDDFDNPFNNSKEEFNNG